MATWKLPRPLQDRVPDKFASNLDELRRRMEELKLAGKRIVFTNGAFDLMHVGHVRSLRHARALGDHLVVAVNGDESVRRAKGPLRPLFPLEERMELVASLECVDTVFAFEEDTADNLLRILKPHVHAKGPDYAAVVPERATVEEYGGEFVIVGDPKDHSSTDLQRLLERLFADGARKKG